MIKYFPIVGIIALGACEITTPQVEFSHSQNSDSDEVTQIASVVVPTPDPAPAPAPKPEEPAPEPDERTLTLDEPALDMSQSVSELLEGVTDQEQVEQILQDKIEHQESQGKRRKQR